MQPSSNRFFSAIPPDTFDAARFVFSGSNFYLATGDQVNNLFSGLILNDPSAWVQEPVRILAMLYLITIFQYIEVLPDCRASDALRERVDWKYALHLPLCYPGLDISLLCKFRRGLLVDQASQHVMQTLLARMGESLLVTRSMHIVQETTEMVQAVCRYNRLAIVWRLVSDVIGTLAAHHPEWLSSVMLPGWYERYSHAGKSIPLPAGNLAQDELAQAIGTDGDYLLEAVSKAAGLGLAELPEIRNLERAWYEQFEREQGEWVWRKAHCASCFSARNHHIRVEQPH